MVTQTDLRPRDELGGGGGIKGSGGPRRGDLNMKGGQPPIHIQRWAPADFQNDEHVRLLYSRRDWRTLTFYRTFIDFAFIKGGDLPSDAESLASLLGMPKFHVERALAFCLNRMIFEENGRLYQGRVRREIAREMEFRESQAEAGKRGGSLAGKGRPLTQLRGSPNPPSPTPIPLSPAPAPTPVERPSHPANPLISGRRPEMEKEGYRLIREINALEPDREATEILLEAAKWQTKDGGFRSKVRLETMTDDHLIRTVHDLKSTLQTVIEEGKHGSSASK